MFRLVAVIMTLPDRLNQLSIGNFGFYDGSYVVVYKRRSAHGRKPTHSRPMIKLGNSGTFDNMLWNPRRRSVLEFRHAFVCKTRSFVIDTSRTVLEPITAQQFLHAVRPLVQPHGTKGHIVGFQYPPRIFAHTHSINGLRTFHRMQPYAKCRSGAGFKGYHGQTGLLRRGWKSSRRGIILNTFHFVYKEGIFIAADGLREYTIPKTPTM